GRRVHSAPGRGARADIAGPGGVLATSVSDGAPHAETGVAADRAAVAIVDVEASLARPHGRDALSTALVRQLTRSRELTDDLRLPMGARICRILARLATRLGQPPHRSVRPGGPEWGRLPCSVAHDDVALRAGCGRVTATRILGELKEAQVLDGRRGGYARVAAALEEAAGAYVYEVL